MESSSRNPLRILRVADLPNNRTSGASRALHSTGDVLASQGHQVDFLFGEDLPGGRSVKLRRFTVPLRLPRLIAGLARTGRRYDVVEMHEPLGAPYCLMLRRAKKKLPPLTLYSHGLEERGHAADLAYRRKKGLPVSLKSRYSPLSVTLQAAYGVRRANHVVCCNSEDVAHLRRAGVPASRLTCLRTGVDPEFVAAGAAREGNENANGDGAASRIVFAGSWLPRKGILDVVPAVSQVMRRRPAVRFTVAGCGFGADTVLSAFDEGLRERIAVLPRITGNADLIATYVRHAVFVLPSFFEGQPAVMIEAAALGLAPVTTNVCGMADFVEDGKNGLTVPVGDVAALAARLETLIDDPALARRLGAAARQKAVREHTWAVSALTLEAAYRQAICDAGIHTGNLVTADA